MEKIYMENNQNQKQKKTFNMLNVTVGLSFAIAFIAVASILLVVAFKPSYSYEELDTLPDTVNAQTIDKRLKGDNAESTFLFMLQYDNKQSRGVCLEYVADYNGGTTLNKDPEEINDVGLIYLIQELDRIGAEIESDYSNGQFGCTADTCSKEDIVAWVKQNAIWAYQAQKHTDDPDTYGQITDPQGMKADGSKSNYFDYNGILDSSVVSRDDILSSEKYTSPEGTWFAHYKVDEVVREALTKQGTLDDVSITLSVANEGNSQWVESGDFYRTGKISVDTIGSGSKVVSASLSGIDKAKLYGCPASGDCKEITDLSNISLGDYDHFRVYVPKDAVSTEKKNVTVVFKYKFDVISGYYYKATGHQTVTLLGTIPEEVSKGLDFTIVKVPDTATDISGTIYVVGLIVLLSGLGILYINVRKQKTQTQQ